jgi:hypothetical protein
MRPWLRITAVVSLSFTAMGTGCGSSTTSSSSPPPLKDGGQCPPVYFGGGTVAAVPPDGASLCAPGDCNYQTQEGCGTTDTCYLKIDQVAGTVVPACRPAGQLEKGAACSAQATDPSQRCARGLFCSNEGCRKLCCGGDWTGCDAGESCIRNLVVTLPDGRSFPANADLCLPVNDCDPLDPEACKADGKVCRVADPVGNVACMSASTLAAGDACDTEHQCGAGLICTKTGSSSQGVCHHLCAFGPCVEDRCGDEGTCVHFPRNPDGVGECMSDWKGPGVVLDADGGVTSDASAK